VFELAVERRVAKRKKMKLSPTEIFKGKKIFFIGGTGFVGKVMLHQPVIGLCNVTD
jgi:hypothetical protein